MSSCCWWAAGLLIKSFMHLREVKPAQCGQCAYHAHLGSARKVSDRRAAHSIFSAGERSHSFASGCAIGGMVLSLPFRGDTFNVWRGYIREGRPATPEENGDAAFLAATPDYFQTLQIPLMAGRNFTDRDTGNAPKVVIVNETMARKLWPGQSPSASTSPSGATKISREIVE